MFTRKSLKKRLKVVEQPMHFLASPFQVLQVESSSGKFSGSNNYHKHAKYKHIYRVESDYPAIRSKKDERTTSNKKRMLLYWPGSSLRTSKAHPSWNRDSVESRPNLVDTNKTKPQLPVLQTRIKRYTIAADFWTHRLSGCSPCYDGTVSSNIAKLVKMFKWL